MDLNHRPLGYEFNTWFWVDSLLRKNQLHTVAKYLIVSTVSGSPVSNLLALFGMQPTRPDPDNRGPSDGCFKPRYTKFADFWFIALASSLSPPAQSAPRRALRQKKQASKSPAQIDQSELNGFDPIVKQRQTVEPKFHFFFGAGFFLAVRRLASSFLRGAAGLAVGCGTVLASGVRT
jgi:hypothetical protein